MILLPTYNLMLFSDDDVTFEFNKGIYDLSIGHLRHWLTSPNVYGLVESDMYVRRTR